jgi:hypothetical protein
MGKNSKRGEAVFFVIAGKIIQLKNQGDSTGAYNLKLGQVFKQSRDRFSTWISVTDQMLGIDIGSAAGIRLAHVGSAIGPRTRGFRRLGQALFQGIKGRRKGIDHGAVTRTCPADLLHSPQPGLQRFAHWQAA